MFKTDSKSLEELSFSLNERDIANFRSILDLLQLKNLLTISKVQYLNAIKGLEEIGKLKLNGQVYAFHVYDSFSEKKGGWEESSGVELYLRQGDTIGSRYQSSTREYVPSVKECCEFLKKGKISTIYTGKLPLKADFLGLTRESDPKDPIIKSELQEDEIQEFKAKGIEVVVLDHLI